MRTHKEILESRIARLEKLLKSNKSIKNEARRGMELGELAITKLDEANSLLEDLCRFLKAVDSDELDYVIEMKDHVDDAVAGLQELVPML